VFAIHGDDGNAACLRSCGDERSCRNECLLVGEGDVAASIDRRKDWGDPRKTDNRGDYKIARLGVLSNERLCRRRAVVDGDAGRQVHGTTRCRHRDRDRSRAALSRLLDQAVRVSSGGEAYDLEWVGSELCEMGRNGECVLADGPR
jgi:hypothetical protein